MTSVAARKQARRFFGTMGAAMRRTSRWLDNRQNERADVMIRRTHSVFSVPADASVTRLMAP
jgi:hypothetical protein